MAQTLLLSLVGGALELTDSRTGAKIPDLGSYSLVFLPSEILEIKSATTLPFQLISALCSCTSPFPCSTAPYTWTKHSAYHFACTPVPWQPKKDFSALIRISQSTKGKRRWRL